jgi:mono/diheme cytochrome c family protein
MRMARRAAALLVVAGCTTAAAEGAGAPSPSDARAAAGMKVYRTYCVGCHGLEASGCGTSARLYRPRPANLTASTRSNEYKGSIIRNGGASMGRSQFMPPWRGEIDDDSIDDVIAYLGTLEPKANPSC